MAKLTQEVQTFIVQQLACFLTPSEVAAAVSEDFGAEIGRQQASKYDPETNPELAPKWRALFEAARAAFVAETATIGIAHRAYRLRRLESYLHRAEETKRYALAAQLLEQAAKEVGGAYSRRRELTRKDGAPLGPQVVVYLQDNGRDGPGGVRREERAGQNPSRARRAHRANTEPSEMAAYGAAKRECKARATGRCQRTPATALHELHSALN
jgi:hypothetical protein